MVFWYEILNCDSLLIATFKREIYLSSRGDIKSILRLVKMYSHSRLNIINVSEHTQSYASREIKEIFHWTLLKIQLFV